MRLSGSRQRRMMTPAGTNATANKANITTGFTTRCKRQPEPKPENVCWLEDNRCDQADCCQSQSYTQRHPGHRGAIAPQYCKDHRYSRKHQTSRALRRWLNLAPCVALVEISRHYEITLVQVGLPLSRFSAPRTRFYSSGSSARKTLGCPVRNSENPCFITTTGVVSASMLHAARFAPLQILY